MRAIILSLGLVSALGLASCMTAPNKNTKTMQWMYNPPNACGSNGSADIEACSRGR